MSRGRFSASFRLNFRSPKWATRAPRACVRDTAFNNLSSSYVLFSTTWISEVCRRAGPAARRTGAERAGELTATVAELAPTAARRAPPPAATRLSDSLGWPDGPRGTLAAPGFPFCFSRENLACPIDHQSDVHVDRMSWNCRQELSVNIATTVSGYSIRRCLAWPGYVRRRRCHGDDVSRVVTVFGTCAWRK